MRPNWPFLAKTALLLLAVLTTAICAALLPHLINITDNECEVFTIGVVAFSIYVACVAAASLTFSFSWYEDAEIKHFGHWLLTAYSAATGVTLMVSFLFQIFAVPVAAGKEPGCFETSNWVRGWIIAWVCVNLPVFLAAFVAVTYGFYNACCWFVRSASVVEDPPIPL